METNYEIKINNKRIFDYYNGSNLSIEHMNLLFINILDKLTMEMDTTLNNNIATQLLDNYTQMNSKIDVIENTINKSHTAIANIMITKMAEYRRDYMNDIKLILSSNNNEKLLPFHTIV